MVKPISCPRCGSVYIKKHGKHTEKQRYRCGDCGQTFTETSSSIFHGQKLNEKTLRKIINLMLNDTKLIAIADVLKLSSRTVYMWRMKIYKVAGEIIKSMMLQDYVWIDETIVTVNKRMIINKTDGRKFRGVSRNQIVVACGVDIHGNKYAEVVGKGHITSQQCIETYGRHIKQGSFIYHDGIFSHDKLILELKANHEIHKSIAKSSKKAMQPINSFGAEIARNLVVHSGLRTENLQDYLNWIVFKNSISGTEIEEKISVLVSKCFKSKIVYRVKDRYYGVFKNKSPI